MNVGYKYLRREVSSWENEFRDNFLDVMNDFEIYYQLLEETSAGIKVWFDVASDECEKLSDAIVDLYLVDEDELRPWERLQIMYWKWKANRRFSKTLDEIVEMQKISESVEKMKHRLEVLKNSR